MYYILVIITKQHDKIDDFCRYKKGPKFPEVYFPCKKEFDGYSPEFAAGGKEEEILNWFSSHPGGLAAREKETKSIDMDRKVTSALEIATKMGQIQNKTDRFLTKQIPKGIQTQNPSWVRKVHQSS